ncbi:MAG: hypothetical protein WB952_22865 [Terriglobales bacterium]
MRNFGNPTKARVRETCGEILPDGTIVDLVAGRTGDGLRLLRSHGKEEPFIGSTVSCGTIVYQAPTPHPSILAAIRFPRGVSPYGTSAQLFQRMRGVYQKWLRWPEDSAVLMAIFALATWVPELLPISLTLCLLSLTPRQVFNLFAISAALCRRALRTSQLSDRLPFFLHPALLVADPLLKVEDCLFWSAVSIRGVHAPGAGGKLRELNVPKAIVLYDPDLVEAWGEEAIVVDAPVIEAPDLDDDLVAQIAEEFQPQLQQFRLDRLRNSRELGAKSSRSATSSLAQNLLALVQEDPEIVQILTRAFQARDEELRRIRYRNPRIAIQSAVWDPAHREKEMGVTDIATRVTAIARSLGGNGEWNARQIGWILRGLQMNTINSGSRKVLRFTDEVRSRILQYVREFGLRLPFVENCPYCKVLQPAEQESVK